MNVIVLVQKTTFLSVFTVIVCVLAGCEKPDASEKRKFEAAQAIVSQKLDQYSADERMHHLSAYEACYFISSELVYAKIFESSEDFELAISPETAKDVTLKELRVQPDMCVFLLRSKVGSVAVSLD